MNKTTESNDILHKLCAGQPLAVLATDTGIRGRNDSADVAWGLGLILAAAVSLLAGGIYPLRGLLVSGLVLVWGSGWQCTFTAAIVAVARIRATGSGAKSGASGSCTVHSCRYSCCREFCC